MKKLLIITPHLSTGGAPQVTLNKIELLLNKFEIRCVEYSQIAWAFVVQRNKIMNLLGDNFYSLPENDKTKLLDIISEFKPDSISFEEFPEFFMSDDIAERIYDKNRTYRIFETTHDSSFPVTGKRWFPDKFIFVSAYNAFRYSIYDIPYEVIEYPVDKKMKNKEMAQRVLNFESDWKHIINVGLFTPRKNQGYLFEIAKRLKNYKVKFHFIGNQADNFKFYWGPLMLDKPENCIIWHERSDVYNFIEAGDVFFFASRGDKNNKELNPIALKEALEYNLPIMMYNLDVYCGKYNNESSITFLTGDLDIDCKNMLGLLGMEYIKPSFVIHYEYGANTIWINYLGSDKIRAIAKIKNMGTGSELYSTDISSNGPTLWWARPVSVDEYLFEHLDNFAGFGIEILNTDTNEIMHKENLMLIKQINNAAGVPIMRTDVSSEVVIISTYPNISKKVELTEDCIITAKQLNRKIILTSHYPVSERIQSLVDYYIYDSNNAMTHHSFYNYFYSHTNEYSAVFNINTMRDSNQSLAAMINLFNGFKLAKSLGFKKALTLVYDIILHNDDVSFVDDMFKKLDNWHCYLAKHSSEMGTGIETTSMGFRIDYFLSKFKDIRTKEDYNEACEKIGAENFLEHYFWGVLKNEDGLWIEPGVDHILPKSGLGLYSYSEYLSILPVDGNENEFVIYFKTYNKDNRKISIVVTSSDSTNFNVVLLVGETEEYYRPITFVNEPVNIRIDYIDDDKIYKTEEYEINSKNRAAFRNYGSFTYKTKKTKIKLVHLQTTNNDERETTSRASLMPVNNFGIDYVLHKNDVYTELPPADTCLRPHCVSYRLFTKTETDLLGTALTPAHYGCYLSFKDAILREFTEDTDFLILCEGDCLLEILPQDFANLVNDVSKIILDNDIQYFSFGDTHTLDFGWPQSAVVSEIPGQDLLFVTNKIIGLQCIMFPRSAREFLVDKLNTHKWDAADIYFNTIFVDSGKKMGILKKRVTTQADGVSLLDKTYKTFIK